MGSLCSYLVCIFSLHGHIELILLYVHNSPTNKSSHLAASATTFSRFIPSVKARFDYGALIFILTFSLVSVSGYRVDMLFELAHQRLATIAIGTSLCILISIIISPVWAGLELQLLISKNLKKLADSLDGMSRTHS